MRGKRSRIDTPALQIDGNFPKRLNCVDVKQCAGGMSHAAQLGHRFDGAHFVVGSHNAYHQSVFINHALQCFRRYPAQAIVVDKLELEAERA